jgi:hypothetical protein
MAPMENIGIVVITAIGVATLGAARAAGRRGVRSPYQPELARLPVPTPDARRRAGLRAVRDTGRGDTDPVSR